MYLLFLTVRYVWHACLMRFRSFSRRDVIVIREGENTNSSDRGAAYSDTYCESSMRTLLAILDAERSAFSTFFESLRKGRHRSNSVSFPPIHYYGSRQGISTVGDKHLLIHPRQDTPSAEYSLDRSQSRQDTPLTEYTLDRVHPWQDAPPTQWSNTATDS